ncbi:MAG: hypothetical protein H7Z11_06885 [Verrucomicrobia bacterium]|nr:hypothetical protein [Leptolyngbya sp. ES-bin-22]
MARQGWSKPLPGAGCVQADNDVSRCLCRCRGGTSRYVQRDKGATSGHKGWLEAEGNGL